MRVVLYTRDFEPITVLELPVWLLEQLERYGGCRLAVQTPPKLVDGEMIVDEHSDLLTIRCEKLRWHDDTVKTILITDNDELALALRPDWLPGQTQAIQWYQRTIMGLVDQLHKALKKN